MSTMLAASQTAETSEQLLARVTEGMGLAADLSRADATLYRVDAERATIIAHACPHSVPPVWRDDVVGGVVPLEPRGPDARALQRRLPATAAASLAQGNTVRAVYPVLRADGEPVGLLAFDRTLIQEERQRHRERVFRDAIKLLQEMAARGQILGAKGLPVFGEHDGILLVDRGLVIQYVSGVATSLYNRAGFMYPLPNVHLDQLPTKDSDLAQRAMAQGMCLQDVEERAEGQYWVKKAIPLYGTREPSRTWRRFLQTPLPAPVLVGAIITIHDETEERRRARELKLKTDMLLELQHRVRNSLQTITALVRIQARRAESAETRAALGEAVNRIMNVAAVHEFLFDPNERRVNLRALTERLVELSRPLVPPPLAIEFHVEGGDIFIDGQRATPAALVISELILNAVEHAFGSQEKGNIWIRLAQVGNRVKIEIQDDGQGAPQGFSPDVGLSLVTTLTRDGLQGDFSIINDPNGGAIAAVDFSPYSARRNNS